MSVSLFTREPRALIKRIVPRKMLDRTLLWCPALYRTRLVNYETNLAPARVTALVTRLRATSALQGDIIECGSSRGGSATIMARALREIGRQKTIFACDSFSGFDREELAKERKAGLTDESDDAFTSTSLAYVKRKFTVLDVDDIVTAVPGYFQDTLPRLHGNFCLAFIDCDLRDSVVYCAQQLWPQVTPGGQMIFDDYDTRDWRGAALGVRDFLTIEAATIVAHGEEAGMYWAVKRG